MSAPANHWKLGAFVLGTTLAALVAIAALAARTLQIETVAYTSYFDEAVSGLELGAPISFRGVKIGNVADIEIAPDRRHVEVRYNLGVKTLRRLGLVSGGEHKETKISVPPDLRVQLGSSGLTGAKFIQLDFFRVGAEPLPVLPFELPENYIPTAQSTMKNLEEAVIRAVDMLPEVAEAVKHVIDKVNLILDDVTVRALPGKMATTLASTQQLLSTAQRKLGEVPVAALSRDTSALLHGATGSLARLDKVLERVDGDHGLLAELQRTSSSFGALAGSVRGEEVAATARELREAAGAVRDFLEALEREPDMLIKGKAPHR